MPTPASGAISFNDIKDNFSGQINADGFSWGFSLANLYNMSYYRGKAHSIGRFPAAPNAISFSNFYGTDGSGYVDPGGGG